MSFSLDLRYNICLQPIELPVFNPVALELLQLLTDPDADINAVISTINKDQSLSVQVLKMANSSAYVGRIKSETIKDSVNRLGARQITNLAMAASQAALHVSDNPLVNTVMQDLWMHSHACAIGCRSLAINSGNPHLSDHAYLAGLLHDVGKLYLLKAMERISKDKATSFTLDRDLLLDVFSDMHVEQGYRIMGHWSIPEVYRDIVANHHSGSFDTSDTLLAIVRLVNFNSMTYDLNLYPQAIQPDNVLREISALRINESVLTKLELDMHGSSA
jgi:HD-like signal output (HDOD) protein